ncbi:MAG: hypothetical protein H6774_00055 [Pseudomonadales bacterium]|nr:hypothetical protein [Candidatus Woesebacteria bacterium]MCB9801468.1 hypothetical protein [Pseudomonadales bacterium]
MITTRSVQASTTTDSPAKFSLYLRVREIAQLGKELEKVMLLDDLEREAWMKENAHFVDEVLENMLYDSGEVLLQEDVYDEEVLSLSEDLLMTMNDALSRLNTMMVSRKKQRSS